MKIGLYFGSFNPIHNGHTSLAQYLIDNLIVDEVWLVVSPISPHKKKADLLDEYIRLDMLMLAIKNYPHFKASDVEFALSKPSYTIDTLNELTSQFPDNQFSLIIGSDNALVFANWKNSHQILEKYPVLVYPRLGFDFDSVSKLYPNMQVLNTQYFNISSTQIRDLIAEKKDVSQWLHPSVYEFIIENDLYSKPSSDL